MISYNKLPMNMMREYQDLDYQETLQGRINLLQEQVKVLQDFINILNIKLSMTKFESVVSDIDAFTTVDGIIDFSKIETFVTDFCDRFRYKAMYTKNIDTFTPKSDITIGYSDDKEKLEAFCANKYRDGYPDTCGAYYIVQNMIS